MHVATSQNRGGIRRGQFSLRSLLAGLTWLAMILAVCLNYQHAVTRQRQQIEARKGTELLEGPRIGWQPLRSSPAEPGK